MSEETKALRRKSLFFDTYYFEKQQDQGKTFSMQEVFDRITKINLWGSEESVSGEGSTESETTGLRMALQALLKQLEIKSIVDAPCGDFGWFSQLDFSRIDYLGIDILADTIQALQWRYGEKANIDFLHVDITQDPLPQADMIVCRDCLVHFSYADIYKAINNFKKSGSKYLLTTTFTNTSDNEDIVTGDWRDLNLQIAPFHFPEPRILITEGCQQNEGLYADKSLALWELAQL